MSKQSEQSAGRAIVTFARGWQTLVAVRSLGRRGVEVVAGDHYSMTPGSLSKYCTAKFKYPDPDRDPDPDPDPDPDRDPDLGCYQDRDPDRDPDLGCCLVAIFDALVF